MNNYFYKFENKLNLGADLAKLKGDNSYGYASNDSRISYSNISDLIMLADIFSGQRIFGIEPHLIYYGEVYGPGTLTPHRDHGASTVANFYFDSNDSITTFYKEKLATGLNGVAQNTGNNIYALDNIEEVCSFRARDGDSYLLNVNEIHGVVSAKPGIRKFINMQWYNVDFATIKNSLLV